MRPALLRNNLSFSLSFSLSYVHQLSNALVACFLFRASLRKDDDLAFATRLVLAWMPLDLLMMALIRRSRSEQQNQRQQSREASICVHHALTVLLCAESLLTGASHSAFWQTRLTRCLLYFEASTPFVCLHNIHPRLVPGWLRNAAWATVRLPASLLLLRTALAYVSLASKLPGGSLLLLHAARVLVLVTALVSLTLAWTLGAVGADVASLVCFLAPLSISAIVLEDGFAFLLIFTTLISSFVFYRRGRELPDKCSICITSLYIASTRFHRLHPPSPSRSPSLALSSHLLLLVLLLFSGSILTATLVGVNAAPVRRRVTNLVCGCSCLFVLTATFRTIDLLSFFLCSFVLLLCIRTGGPMRLSYGLRCGWHCAACGLTTCMLLADPERDVYHS